MGVFNPLRMVMVLGLSVHLSVCLTKLIVVPQATKRPMSNINVFM